MEGAQGSQAFQLRGLAALVAITSKQERHQMSAEEALKREITARGPVGVGRSSTLVPREELRGQGQGEALVRASGHRWRRGHADRRRGKERDGRRRALDQQSLQQPQIILWNELEFRLHDRHSESATRGRQPQSPMETLLRNVRENKLLWASV